MSYHYRLLVPSSNKKMIVGVIESLMLRYRVRAKGVLISESSDCSDINNARRYRRKFRFVVSPNNRRGNGFPKTGDYTRGPR